LDRERTSTNHFGSYLISHDALPAPGARERHHTSQTPHATAPTIVHTKRDTKGSCPNATISPHDRVSSEPVGRRTCPTHRHETRTEYHKQLPKNDPANRRFRLDSNERRLVKFILPAKPNQQQPRETPSCGGAPQEPKKGDCSRSMRSNSTKKVPKGPREHAQKRPKIHDGFLRAHHRTKTPATRQKSGPAVLSPILLGKTFPPL